MTCAELKEQAAAYALGVLEPAERAACDQHLARVQPHEGCREALREAGEQVALLAAALPPVSPSAGTWSAIEARLGPPAGRSWAVWLVAAAALLLLIFFVRDRAELATLHHDAEVSQQAMALLAQPGAQLVALQGTTAASAKVILHAGDPHAFLLGHGLTAPAGKDYELWLIRGARKIPAGLLRADATGALTTTIDLSGGLPDAVAVTLEAAGGRPQPEGPIVLSGKI